MSAIKDGGPAFPPHEAAFEFVGVETGMSLRDWFATHASEEDISAHREMAIECDGFPYWSRSREEARYRYADAMLAAREASDV